MPYYNGKYRSSLAVLSMVACLPLLANALLFGILAKLVVKGKISLIIAVGIAFFVICSASITSSSTMRWFRYRDRATVWEETYVTLSSEADSWAKELERLRSAGSPMGVQMQEKVKIAEEEMYRRKIALAYASRQLQIYRRAASRPWLAIEE